MKIADFGLSNLMKDGIQAGALGPSLTRPMCPPPPAHQLPLFGDHPLVGGCRS